MTNITVILPDMNPKIKNIISSITYDKRVVITLFVIIALVSAVKQYTTDSYNNYKIYKYTFWHTVEKSPLYDAYPNQYADTNHYGPAFALVIAPFALLPDALGTSLWNISNALIPSLGFFSL
ncbi:MAG: hypothetical protein ACYCZO_08625 [Daejeonella sp.]